MTTRKRILFFAVSSSTRTLDWAYERDQGFVQKPRVSTSGAPTLAALTPDEYDVEIWDEHLVGELHDASDVEGYDLYAVSVLFSVANERATRLIKLLVAAGYSVIAGGPAVSLEPERYAELGLLTSFIGEAERTWPQFLRDWSAGEVKEQYRQVEKPDLEESPVPRWDLLPPSSYLWYSVQTTRGCPFDCDFCDVIYLLGRRQRHKNYQQVLDELRMVQAHGATRVMFSDDEFFGDPKWVKGLLREVIELNKTFPRPLIFGTQATLNVSRDPEMLELYADANMYRFCVGVESPNKDNLKDVNKLHNLKFDMVESFHEIFAYGVGIIGSFIVGLDHDDESCFELIYDTCQRGCVPVISVHLLEAGVGTRLWKKLKESQRIVHPDFVPRSLVATLARSSTNVIPARISRHDLLIGFRDLLTRLSDWEGFTERIVGFVDKVRREPQNHMPICGKDEVLADVARLSDVGPDAMRAIGDILDHTEARAPFMMNRVADFISKHISLELSKRGLYDALTEQAKLERSVEGKLTLDDSRILVPRAFERSFEKEIFRRIYRRLYINLDDAAHVAEAATRVTVDFLVRWGRSFTDVESHHLVFFDELCDRVAAEFNGVAPEAFLPREDTGQKIPDPRRTRLWQSVLKNTRDSLAI